MPSENVEMSIEFLKSIFFDKISLPKILYTFRFSGSNPESIVILMLLLAGLGYILKVLFSNLLVDKTVQFEFEEGSIDPKSHNLLKFKQ